MVLILYIQGPWFLRGGHPSTWSHQGLPLHRRQEDCGLAPGWADLPGISNHSSHRRRLEATGLLLLRNSSTRLSWHFQDLGACRLQEKGGGFPHGGLHARCLLCGQILGWEGVCLQWSNIEWDWVCLQVYWPQALPSVQSLVLLGTYLLHTHVP